MENGRLGFRPRAVATRHADRGSPKRTAEFLQAPAPKVRERATGFADRPADASASLPGRVDAIGDLHGSAQHLACRVGAFLPTTFREQRATYRSGSTPGATLYGVRVTREAESGLATRSLLFWGTEHGERLDPVAADAVVHLLALSGAKVRDLPPSGGQRSRAAFQGVPFRVRPRQHSAGAPPVPTAPSASTPSPRRTGCGCSTYRGEEVDVVTDPVDDLVCLDGVAACQGVAEVVGEGIEPMRISWRCSSSTTLRQPQVRARGSGPARPHGPEWAEIGPSSASAADRRSGEPAGRRWTGPRA